MSIESILNAVYHGSISATYGGQEIGLLLKTISIGFFCIEDWGPWT